MHLNLLRKKIFFWLILSFAFELAIACPVYQVVHHTEILSLSSDDFLEDHVNAEEEICIFCFNNYGTFTSILNYHPFLNPESRIHDTYVSVETDNNINLYRVRPPPDILSKS